MVSETEFLKIIDINKGSIYTICYMFSKDREDVNDLYQEVILNLWKGYETFRGESKISTWIYKVSLNTCLLVNRKKKKIPQFISLSESMNIFEEKDDDSKQIMQLYKRINKLGKIDKAIILLWLENFSYEEIGEIIGITAKNVSVRLFRIKEQLKRM